MSQCLDANCQSIISFESSEVFVNSLHKALSLGKGPSRNTDSGREDPGVWSPSFTTVFFDTSVFPLPVASHLIRNMRCLGLKPGEYLNGGGGAPDEPPLLMPALTACSCVLAMSLHGLCVLSKCHNAGIALRLPGEQTEV